jgi:hypothetical protein
MAHKEQIQYCTKIKNKLPHFFHSKKVLDIGSLDINGSNRYLFTNCEYLGIDIGEGKNVDLVCKGHEYSAPDATYDIVISTECFEHDMYYELTIKNAMRLLKSGGLFLFTCATTGRAEHGTKRSSPSCAPLLQETPDWQDYYKNLTEEDIESIVDLEEVFSEYEFEVNPISCDLYFYGVKR